MLRFKRLNCLIVLTMVSCLNSGSPSFADDTIDDIIADMGTNAKISHLEGTAKKDVSVPEKTGGWFLKPVTRLQGEVVRLEERLAKLSVPLNRLEPGTDLLARNMTEIRAQTQELIHQLDSTQTDMRLLQVQINTLRQPVIDLKNPVMQLRTPVITLRDPIRELKDPLRTLNDRVFTLQKPLMSVDSGVSSLGARFSKLDGRFTELDGRFIELDGRFANLDDRFARLDGRFAKLDGRFAALGSELINLQSVLFWHAVAITVALTVTIAMGGVLVFSCVRAIRAARREM